MNPFASSNESTISAPKAGMVKFPTQTSLAGQVVPALLRTQRTRSAGKVRPMVLLWALGVPIPILLIIFLVRGCS